MCGKYETTNDVLVDHEQAAHLVILLASRETERHIAGDGRRDLFLQFALAEVQPHARLIDERRRVAVNGDFDTVLDADARRQRVATNPPTRSRARTGSLL